MTIAHDLAALIRIYDEVDARLSGWTCDRSTDCCHFGRTGREPYLWPNEWALVERELRRRPLPRSRRLPIAEDGRCPLLDDAGRCVIYAVRPFGCRTFFCDRAVGHERRPPRAELLTLGRRVAALADAAEPRVGPRTLSAWLDGSKRSLGPARR